MRNSNAQPLVAEVLRCLDEGGSWRTSPHETPASHYTDRAHLQLELDTLFRGPQVVALSPDLPGPNTFVTRDQYDVPLLLTRDAHGQVHAAANVCTHRGAQVVAPGRGQARRHTCPYHAWTYDSATTLVGVPDAGAFPDVCPGSEGLAPVPVVERDGVIWADPRPGAPAFDAAALERTDMAAFADDIVDYDIAGHRYWRTHRFDLAMNWKLVIDTFLEPYHFAALHKQTVGPYFVANLCVAHRSGPHVREVLPRKTFAEMAGQDPTDWNLVPHTAMVYVMFPNTVFVMQIDHIETWRVTPDRDDPGRCIVDLDFYIPDQPATESSERHWEKNWQLTIDTVIGEDFAAMESAQRGMASGAIDKLRLGANEPALGLFHQALADAIAEQVA